MPGPEEGQQPPAPTYSRFMIGFETIFCRPVPGGMEIVATTDCAEVLRTGRATRDSIPMIRRSGMAFLSLCLPIELGFDNFLRFNMYFSLTGFHAGNIMNVPNSNIFEKRYSQVSILSGFDIIRKKHSNLLNIVREEKGRLPLPSVASG